MRAMNMNYKPECRLVGENGNVFNLVAIAKKVLKQHGFKDEAAEMQQRVFNCGSYKQALEIIEEYVDVV